MLIDNHAGASEGHALRLWTAYVAMVSTHQPLTPPSPAVVVDEVLLRRHGACWSSCAGGCVALTVTGESADDAHDRARRRWYYLAEELGLQAAPVEIVVEGAA